MRPCLITLLVACTVYAAACIAAERPKLAPTNGVVLLRNGEILAGTISHAGDFYYISKPGSEIRLKATEVEQVADNLEGIYLEKRSRATTGKLQDHLVLAEWCIEHKLVDQADHELKEAETIDPQSLRLPLLRRRLELAQPNRAGPATTQPPVESSPANDELDRLVRGLPGHAVESFTSTVQPLLVNNCTTSGCHGPRSQGKLRLLRLSLASPANRRLTQRNLYSVWQVIDANQPASSPLLTQPIGPHGKAKGPIFSGREAAQYRQLVSWVYAVTRQRKPMEPPPEDQGDSSHVAALGQPKVKVKKQKPRTEAPPNPSLDEAVATSEPNEDELAPPELADHGDSQPIRRPEESLVNDDEYIPVDPFDPEIFNRRYFPR
jgi:hypothetical protein